MKVRFGGTEYHVEEGTTVLDFLVRTVGMDEDSAVAARLNGEIVDLSRPLEEGSLELVTWDDEEGKEIYRHTASHVMAQAVMELFPGTKLAVGPAIKDGFYYDFDLREPITPEDLPRIEQRMADIVERDLPLRREVRSRAEAVELFRSLGQDYKVELLEEIPEEEVTLYRQGDFVDLCRGPHLPSTGRLRHFRLLSLAGAYWRGDETRPMLQRIYGTAFRQEEELAAYLDFLREAERRDHRRLGRELDLFSFHEEAGPGVVFYHPRGAVLRGIIEDFLKEEHRKRGYQMVITPHLFRGRLWHESGHMDYYRENMYVFEKEGVEYVVKPMNCPGHVLIYKTRPRSYRELPLKFFELGTVYRHERSGVLHGLMRVRGFTQDDAHIFCREDQLREQVEECLEFAFHSLRTFGFRDFEVYLSTRPEKSVGSDELWEKATSALRDSLQEMGIPFQVDPGEGVFYGPKIDVKLKDAIGRSWQGPTVQADFNLPERFDLHYTGQDNRPHRPVVIHRVVLAGIERFYGVLLEHYAGELPPWLAPVQVVVVPIADRHLEYARRVRDVLAAEGLRVEVDEDRETVSMKVRRAQLLKIPFTLVVGDREVEGETVSVRDRAGRDVRGVPLREFLDRLKAMVEGRAETGEWVE
ncbi:threonine--tRNA ligase [Candidatus Solincola tengchongensis]|uniref:threonine--tRNA ligase n=1 Tax=Candidatus Solincola tengchongensis TaxID=2900693 RepID=UPI00257EF881|nr:threonine--tRNA ligase [Candidatus Solincola tengchongensis]